MNKLIILIWGLISFHFAIGQQSENYLLGKVYTKSTGQSSSDNIIDLNFNNKTSGISESTTSVLGREVYTKIGFTYIISGDNVKVIYDKNLGVEDYSIDKINDKLKSTHLEGYVDGKWSKLTFKRKIGAGTPGQVEGSNLAWNKVPEAINNQIRIGSQVWMAKNLDLDSFQNGEIIAEAKSKEEWLKFIKEEKAAWCYYNNDPENGKKYGKLYNWYAVNDIKKIAPIGWHIPTSEEWDELTVKNLGSNGSQYARPGFDMKSREGWSQSNNSPVGFGNTSGFTALPGGFRQNDCLFNGINNYSVWWSATKSKLDSWNRGISYDGSTVNHFTFLDKSAGLSIRLIQDNSISKNSELVLVKNSSDSKFELKLSNNASNTAVLKIYKNQILNTTINGNWKIETGSDGIDNIFMTYMTQNSGGYESSYGVKKFTFKCAYDNSKKITHVYEPTIPNDLWYNIEYYNELSRQKPKIKANKDDEKKLNDTKLLEWYSIVTTIKIGKLDVAQQDLPLIRMKYKDAKKVCSELKDGWRLPTKDELNKLYKSKNKIGGFSSHWSIYWSSTEDGIDTQSNEEFAWVQDFEDGMQQSSRTAEQFNNIRLVRSLDDKEKSESNDKLDKDNNKSTIIQNNSKIEVNSLKIGRLEVALNDISGKMTWSDAIKACSSLGKGWHLPSINELKILLENKDKIGGFGYDNYWSSTEDGKEDAMVEFFGGNKSRPTGSSKFKEYLVRPVR